jgi:hypothetical protein
VYDTASAGTSWQRRRRHGYGEPVRGQHRKIRSEYAIAKNGNHRAKQVIKSEMRV